MRQKKCRVCGEKFTPFSSIQRVCSLLCSTHLKKDEKKKEKKKPKPKLSTLITKADTLASQYIRQKNADHAGMVKCVSCSTVLHWKDAHCAHWMPRAAKATRWMEENLSAACPSCNVYRKEMHQREFTLFQLDRYGREGIEFIKAKSKKVLAGSQVRKLAEEAIEYYSKALEELKRD